MHLTSMTVNSLDADATVSYSHRWVFLNFGFWTVHDLYLDRYSTDSYTVYYSSCCLLLLVFMNRFEMLQTTFVFNSFFILIYNNFFGGLVVCQSTFSITLTLTLNTWDASDLFYIL